MMSPHPNNPLIYSVGVAQISGGSFFLRSRFKRLRFPFQDTPVYMVTRTTNYIVTSTCLSLFKITKHTPLQICDKHHQQEEQYLENKHALQALPGCIDKQTSILKLIGCHIGRRWLLCKRKRFQGTGRSTLMKMMAHNPVSVLLLPLLMQV